MRRGMGVSACREKSTRTTVDHREAQKLTSDEKTRSREERLIAFAQCTACTSAHNIRDELNSCGVIESLSRLA